MVWIYRVFLMLLFLPSVCAVEAERVIAWRNSYNTLLQKYVKIKLAGKIKTSRVDYAGIHKSGKIPVIMAELHRVRTLKGMNPQEKLAFWLNVYNFLTIAKASKHPNIKKLTELNKIFKSVWVQDAGFVLGKMRSLDEIEHKIIRKDFNEPRIHFALVCAAKSCPNLRPEAYCGVKLKQQLQSQLLEFTANPTKGIKVDKKTKTIYISKLFKWFSSDFPGGVLPWLNKQKIINKTELNYKVKYLHYDWNLNKL